MGIWSGDLGERVSSTTKAQLKAEALQKEPFLRVSSPDTNSSLQMDQSHTTPPRYPAHVKENGRSLSTQGAPDSTTAVIHTPTPPPLKPAPSPFSTTSFPSLGQMPSLVPGAPAPKASPSPQPDREEASQSAYSKTAALVSPGPVTISWSHDSGPSVALSTSVGFCPNPPTWGRQTEVRWSIWSTMSVLFILYLCMSSQFCFCYYCHITELHAFVFIGL